MKTAMLLRSGLFAATAAAGLAASGQAQAGLFDFLFGGFQQPQIREYGPAPLDVRVNPRRNSRAAVDRRSRIVRGERPQAGENRTARAQSIDPVKNPNWYLDDPTLRRGDIVVLKGGVLVYGGGSGPRAREDFTSLARSPLVSKSEKERLQKSAGVVPGGPEPVTPAAKQAVLDVTE